MLLAQLDVGIRGATATLLVLLALRMAVSGPRDWRAPSMLFLPVALCVAAFVLRNTPFVDLRPSNLLADVATATRGLTALSIWWFCLACFERPFRPTRPMLSITAAWLVVYPLAQSPTLWSSNPAAWIATMSLLVLAMYGHLATRLLAMRDGDLIEARRDARIWVVALLCGQGVLDLATDLLFGFAWRPLAFSMSQNAIFLGFALWLNWSLLVPNTSSLTFGVGIARPALRPVEPRDPINRVARVSMRARLRQLVERDHIYLDPDLTFQQFAAAFGASEKVVRRVVNRDMGFDHFRGFLNHFRLAEARRRLADPAHGEDKMIAIAQDCGFASIQTFNRIFREAEGCSPSEYRARAATERQRLRA